VLLVWHGTPRPLAIFLLSIGKVFLYDLTPPGLYRVVSWRGSRSR
jgi:hypothetical protein